MLNMKPLSDCERLDSTSATQFIHLALVCVRFLLGQGAIEFAYSTWRSSASISADESPRNSDNGAVVAKPLPVSPSLRPAQHHCARLIINTRGSSFEPSFLLQQHHLLSSPKQGD